MPVMGARKPCIRVFTQRSTKFPGERSTQFNAAHAIPAQQCKWAVYHWDWHWKLHPSLSITGDTVSYNRLRRLANRHEWVCGRKIDRNLEVLRVGPCMLDHMTSLPEKLLYEQSNIASSNGNRLDVAANDVPVGNRDDVRYPVATVNHCTRHRTSFLLHVHSNLSHGPDCIL